MSTVVPLPTTELIVKAPLLFRHRLYAFVSPIPPPIVRLSNELVARQPYLTTNGISSAGMPMPSSITVNRMPSLLIAVRRMRILPPGSEYFRALLTRSLMVSLTVPGMRILSFSVSIRKSIQQVFLRGGSGAKLKANRSPLTVDVAFRKFLRTDFADSLSIVRHSFPMISNDFK